MGSRGGLVLVAALLAVTCGLCSCRGLGTPQVTSIERQVDESVVRDGLGEVANRIVFANPRVRVNPEDTDELLVDIDVTNNGTLTVTRLDVWADFYNSDGRKAADEGEDLVDDHHNSHGIPPGQTQRATIELDSPEDWSGGKMVVIIREIRVR